MCGVARGMARRGIINRLAISAQKQIMAEEKSPPVAVAAWWRGISSLASLDIQWSAVTEGGVDIVVMVKA